MPHTRKWRGGPGGVLRSPKTTAEMRLNQDFGEALEPLARAKRRKLPGSFDDQVRSDGGVRTWKKARRHQWH